MWVNGLIPSISSGSNQKTVNLRRIEGPLKGHIFQHFSICDHTQIIEGFPVSLLPFFSPYRKKWPGQTQGNPYLREGEKWKFSGHDYCLT